MSPSAKAPVQPLRELARLYGVQTAFYDVAHQRRQASSETLLLVLRALGAPVETLYDVPAALRERRQALWKRCMEPVVVAWDGEPAELELRLSADRGTLSVVCHLKLETGGVQSWADDLARLPPLQEVEVEGVRYTATKLVLPGSLPWGYHRLTLEMQGRLFETMIISTPRRAYPPSDEIIGKLWGVFMPLYALHSLWSWGSGDFSDLEALMAWIAGLGGTVVATLPFPATFFDEPFDASPYAPASRLFWNEFYIDITRVPELNRCPTAQALLESAEVQRELAALRSSSFVDYRRQMALKRKVLEELARCFFAETPGRYAAFQRFMETHPAAEDYARFRATGDRQRAPWTAWPQPLRDGVFKPGDYDEEAKRYHLYAQWLADEQLQALSGKGQALSLSLHLDLPLGVHPDSYDVWRERETFALDVSGGAPADAFFTKGQNWGFPPLHPETIREQGYRYYIACLRHHLQHARLLRIDHVMGLHRLFWIPKGLEPSQGVYVRYPAEEIYAILSLESHRHRALIVGEDLGTVPRYIRPAMARHNVHSMYVAQYELTTDSRRPLPAIPPNSVASLNTHDMPPFAAFWQGVDIEDRLDLGLTDEASAQREREHRQALKQAIVSFLKRRNYLKGASDTPAILRACLAYLSASPAWLVLVNLEDLWQETQPQNMPGTREERPNWRRKACHSLERFCQMPQVVDTLRQVDSPRKRT